ncbi:MAG: hypothetical protein WC367_03420 [Methanoregula sp.]|jgi:hypothetical protein
MTHRREHVPDSIVSLLPGFEEELFDLARTKYGKEAAGELARECESFSAALVPFVRTLARFSADPEMRVTIGRSYRECERLLRIDTKIPANTGIFFETLDNRSRQILFTLSAKGYASLDELSEAVRATHSEVLQRLRDVIIPESVRRFGIPLAVFRESKTDPVTGESILFSWWLNDEFLSRAGQIEVMEDEEQVLVTVDLAGSDLPRSMRASATCSHGVLEVQVKKGRRSHGRR